MERAEEMAEFAVPEPQPELVSAQL
jgi:hypothetical protein